MGGRLERAFGLSFLAVSHEKQDVEVNLQPSVRQIPLIFHGQSCGKGNCLLFPPLTLGGIKGMLCLKRNLDNWSMLFF